jgi:class 3 adenylate cyclase/tetratricopeptide (TPR) repeat protein
MSASPCAACGFPNPAGALFCGRCGNALGQPCPSCGTVVGPGLAYCTSCGFALAEADAPEAVEERKVVTVVFVDLVGFTGRAERLDPEDVRGLLAPYHSRAKSELERFGGTVEKIIGDAVMAVFGAPIAHEDDPERAVRAALAVREAIAELNAADPSLRLSVRIGAATGEALVNLNARPEHGEALAAGDVLNTASRLQSAAPADGILVDEATRRAIEHAIELREAEPVEAKGKAEPVQVWEPVAPRARLGVDIAFRGGAPLVGRADELDALLDAVNRAERDRAPQLVTLVGVPGIGKSRLVWELFSALDSDPAQYVTWRQGRSLPYGDGVAFWALGEMTKAQAGILETDDAGTTEAKLRAAVENVVSEPAEARWVEGHLRPLAGLAADAAASTDQAGEAAAAWRRFFEALAEQRPLILVFEDLHWADDGLLEFVDQMADWTTDVPLLILCTTRPELLDRRPGWGGGKRNATTISLAPLSQGDTAELISSLLDGRVQAEDRPELLARAGGNPLYAEEFVRMLAQAEEELPLPESVQGIIAARLDTLPPDEKTLIQAAAIVGKVFWPDALVAMLGLSRADVEVEESLRLLERKEFVRRERRSSIAGETAYVFRHVLVRDVAYSQIPRRRRADMHRLAATWIEALASDRPEDLADMVAHHYLSALDLDRRTGREDPELALRARTALVDAGDRSFALNAFPAAARFYEQALGLSAESDAERPRMLLSYGRALFQAEGGGKEALREAADAFLEAGEREQAALALVALADFVHFIEGKGQEAAANLDLAISLVADSPPSAIKAGVLANRARFHMIADEADRAIPLADEALALATSLGLEELQAHTLNTRGVARTLNGDLGGVDDLERAVEIAPPLSFELMRALNNLVSTLVELGELERGFALMTRSLEAARRHGNVVAVAWVETQQLDRLYWIGAWEELLERAEQMLDAETSSTPALMAIDAYIFRARLRLAKGQVEGAVEDSAKLVDHARIQGDPQVAFPAFATRAHVLYEAGRHAEAGIAVDELLDRWRASPSSAAGPWVAELAHVLDGLGRGSELAEASAKVRLRTRWLDAAQALTAGDPVRAAQIYEELGARSDAAKTGLRAAELLAAAGRREEAQSQLSSALEFFRQAGATRYVREAEALLAVR